jgi:hypothetical protein
VISAFLQHERELKIYRSDPDIAYFGADQTGLAERAQFLEWYRRRREADKVFDNKRVLEAYCQVDVTVLRQSCQVFRREIMAIGNIEVFV